MEKNTVAGALGTIVDNMCLMLAQDSGTWFAESMGRQLYLILACSDWESFSGKAAVL